MRFLHTMLRVRDLDKSVEFFTQALGMHELRRKDYPDGKFTLCFLGYGPEKENTVIELTHNWEKDDYENGNAYGHIAIGVDDLQGAYDKALQFGASPKVPPKVFGSGTRLAFVRCPDGYDVEFIELASKKD